MQGRHLEIVSEKKWHYEYFSGDLRLVGRLMASGEFELLEKHWRSENGKLVPYWKEQRIIAPAARLERLVQFVESVWVEGHPLRVEFGAAINTAYWSLNLTVHLDDAVWTLKAETLDEITGPDSLAVSELLKALDELTAEARVADNFSAE